MFCWGEKPFQEEKRVRISFFQSYSSPERLPSKNGLG